jgi:outer membrane receptor for ferrienterochelin and colicin
MDMNEEFSSKAASGWGNTIGAFRWNYVINNTLFSNTTFTYSNYDFFVNTESEERSRESDKKDFFKAEYTSGITDWTAKSDFDFIPSTRHYIRFGGSFTAHAFNPGVSTLEMRFNAENNTNLDTSFGNYKINAQEISFYIEDDIEVSPRFKINPGVHFSVFHVKSKSYSSIQPRLSARYMITEDLSAKASVAQMKQYIHLLTTSNIGLPTDLWVPATDLVSPMDAWQYSLGLRMI